MRRRLYVLHAPARRQVFRRDVQPRLPVIASDLERAVVRAGPDHALFERRLRDRVQRAVEFFAGDVASDRLAADALTTRRMRSEVGRDLLPRHAFVAGAMNVLRSVIQNVWIVRRGGHRGHSLKTVNEVTGRITIE